MIGMMINKKPTMVTINCANWKFLVAGSDIFWFLFFKSLNIFKKKESLLQEIEYFNFLLLDIISNASFLF